MANTITTQTLIDGERDLVVAVTLTADGTGDESATNLIDISTYKANSDGVAPADVYINKVYFSTINNWITLLWDATANRPFFIGHLYSSYEHDYTKFGGLRNPRTTGWTGDILITTAGLAAGQVATFVLDMSKRYS